MEKRCEDCRYYVGNFQHRNIILPMCALTNILHKNTSAKTCRLFNVDISGLDICYNCKHFLGGSDWGLACSKHYHKLPEALTKMCEDAERKQK